MATCLTLSASPSEKGLTFHKEQHSVWWALTHLVSGRAVVVAWRVWIHSEVLVWRHQGASALWVVLHPPEPWELSGGWIAVAAAAQHHQTPPIRPRLLCGLDDGGQLGNIWTWRKDIVCRVESIRVVKHYVSMNYQSHLKESQLDLTVFCVLLFFKEIFLKKEQNTNIRYGLVVFDFLPFRNSNTRLPSVSINVTFIRIS